MTKFWDPVDIAWMAGIIEGEGTIHCARQGRVVRVQVAMTDEDTIDRLRDLSGIGRKYGPHQDKRPNHKLSWQWHVAKKSDVARLLLAIAPMMSQRRTVAIADAIEHWAKPRNYEPVPIAHGTAGGWYLEKSRGIPHCAACLDAKRLYHRDYAKSRRATDPAFRETQNARARRAYHAKKRREALEALPKGA